MENIHFTLVDVQDGFVPENRREDIDAIIPVIVSIVQHCRDLAIPMTAVVFNGKGEIIPELLPLFQPDEIITKWFRDAFTSLTYAERVDTAEELWYAGLYFGSCIRSTANSALRAGKRVSVFENASISGGPLLSRLAVRHNMRAKGMNILHWPTA